VSFVNEDEIQIGELARAAGLTVRTLHHYDAIGLLVPAQRSASGRRLYSPAEVQRLYRIVALRRLGLSLDEVGEILDRSPDLASAVRRHLARVDRDLRLVRRLRGTLRSMLALLERGGEPTLDEFIEAIEVMTMTESYYTPEQLERLERRREELGDAGMVQADRDWAELITAVRGERASGTDPADPRMQHLARRWRSLVEQFTGGDEGIRDSLHRMYRDQAAGSASRGTVDPEVMAFVGQALAKLS
jgi:MerR family transcriptional regulator, thiopeptide resistance regulator